MTAHPEPTRGAAAILTALLTLTALPALAADPFFDSEVVEALQAKELPKSVTAPEWDKAPPKAFRAAAQHTVKLNDQNANLALQNSPVNTATVRALYTDKELAIRVEWMDETKTLMSRTETNTFGDSVALEIPVRFGGDLRMPYVGMGDEKSYVYVYMQRAAEDAVLENTYVGGGFGSLTRIQSLKAKMTMAYDPAQKVWRAMFVRPLVDQAHALDQGLVPVAFALWNGERFERGGNKYLTSWKFIRLGRYPLDQKFVDRVSWGFRPGDLGDAAKGKATFQTICIACHRTNDLKIALDGMAPDLTDVGAIAEPTYLRDSIKTPSEVVVINLNPNRSYNKGAVPDANRAYPNNEALTWFAVDGNGQRISKMPQLTNLTDDDVKNLVAYLRSLDGSGMLSDAK